MYMQKASSLLRTLLLQLKAVKSLGEKNTQGPIIIMKAQKHVQSTLS